MEITNYEEENSEFEKRRLFETAEWTLLRLNQTINEMKSWTLEREILQSDIYRLKIALSYSEKSLGDALVIHQNEEIERLTKLNDDMRTKVKSLTLALMNAESTVSWNTERKLRNEMAVLKSQMANDKLRLAREIMYLRDKLNEKETDATLYHEITVKLDKYSDEDNELDIIFSELSRKLINTINELSLQLISAQDGKFVNENICNENYVKFSDKNDFKIENEHLLKEMEEKINKIFIDRELKVKAFKRDTSRLKTKLAIVQLKNEKLIGKINEFEGNKGESVKNDVFSQTDFFDDEKINCDYDKLIELIEENKNLMNQLEMERTTAREALKEFEKSVNETEDKVNELKKADEKINSMNNELMRLRIENRSLKELKINYKKKNARLDEESMKERELLINKINNLRGKLRKLTCDNKKLEGKLIESSKKIDEINLKLEKFMVNEENYLMKINQLNEEIGGLKLNLINSEENLLKINNEFLSLKKINCDAEILINEFRENIEINLNKLIGLEIENKELKNIVNKKIETTSKECQVVLSSSQREFLSIVGKNNSSDCTERIVEGSCEHENKLIKEIDDADEIKFSLNLEKFDKIGNFKKDDKSMRGNWTIKNKLGLAPERIMKNLEDTDRQLLSVKCELSRVRDEIREMRSELKGKRFIIRRYQMENDALKEELARLRYGIEKLGEENKCLRSKKKK